MLARVSQASTLGAMDMERFCRLRPWLYHLTARENVGRIVRMGRLIPAAETIECGLRSDLRHERRGEPVRVAVSGEVVHVRDQRPLYERNVSLEGGWSFGDLVAALNERVYFWPGGEAGPIGYGRRHFGRYSSDDCVVLRARTAAVFGANPKPEFCRVNSGSPRWSRGRASVRGPRTFVAAGDFDGGPGEVVEVTYRGRVLLPVGAVELRSLGGGEWKAVL
jgi:hypothetical protein